VFGDVVVLQSRECSADCALIDADLRGLRGP
jgi:hypothetical protein